MEHEHISSLTLAVHCCFGWSTGFWGLESVSSLQSWAQTIHFILLCPQFWDRHNSIHMYHSMKIVFVMTLVLMHIHSSMVACLVYEPSSAVAVSCGRYYLNNRTQSPSQNINHPSQHSIQFQQFLRPLLLPITYNLVTNVHERLFGSFSMKSQSPGRYEASVCGTTWAWLSRRKTIHSFWPEYLSMSVIRSEP